MIQDPSKLLPWRWIPLDEEWPPFNTDVEFLEQTRDPDTFTVKIGQSKTQNLAGTPTKSNHEWAIYQGKPILCLINATHWRHRTTYPVEGIQWSALERINAEIASMPIVNPYNNDSTKKESICSAFDCGVGADGDVQNCKWKQECTKWCVSHGLKP